MISAIIGKDSHLCLKKKKNPQNKHIFKSRTFSPLERSHTLVIISLLLVSLAEQNSFRLHNHLKMIEYWMTRAFDILPLLFQRKFNWIHFQICYRYCPKVKNLCWNFISQRPTWIMTSFKCISKYNVTRPLEASDMISDNGHLGKARALYPKPDYKIASRPTSQ